MVAVLMSTYNGSRYLSQQLESVLQQTVGDFTLLIRDDGSKDDTLQLLQQCQDPRVRVFAGKNLGPSGSFFALLEEARKLDADQVFFCDQDDIWMPQKIELLLAELAKCPSGPALVFSDFSMIDGEGNITGDSYANMAQLRIPRDGNFFPKLLAQPYVFGCASVLNKALLDLIANPPEGIEMYDCWIALVASVFGTVRYLATPTIYHRFHTNNATGKAGMNTLSSRIRRVTGQLKQQSANTALRLHQAQLLLDRYGSALPAQYHTQLAQLANAGKTAGFSAVKTLRKYAVARGGRLQNGFFYLTAFIRR